MSYDFTKWSRYPAVKDLKTDMLNTLEDFVCDDCQWRLDVADLTQGMVLLRTLWELHQREALVLDETIDDAFVFVLPGSKLEEVRQALYAETTGATPPGGKKTGAGGRRPNEEAQERSIELSRQGVDVKSIAIRLDVHKSSVYRWTQDERKRAKKALE